MSIKLYYFDTRGICEPIRMILSYGGADFEDIRAPVEKFPPTLPSEIKAKCRWGQVPLVEFEGKSLTQSLAVTRYFAKKFDLVPKDPYEAALCDEYVDAVRDLMPGFYGALLTEDPAEKETKLAETVKNAKAKYLGVYDSLIKSNDGIHLVTSSLTWADICLAYVMDQVFLLLGVDLTEGYPNIKALKDNVFNTKGIKEWVEKRPKTKY